MSKKILFIEDLYDFYLNKYKRSTHFSSEKTGSPIVVQVHGKVRFEESDKNKDGLCPVHLQACHTNLNINNSNIDEIVMEAALPSFSNRPILGYIHKVVTDENPDGQWEFYSHNFHEDENGEIVYDEVPIGIIPESCNAQLVYDEEKDKTYCEVDGYIFDEYSKASEILKREGECAVSVELSIRELSYDAKQKFLNIEDFWFSGVTILGKTPQGETVKPGMVGSNIKLTDFSEKNNSLFSKYGDRMIEFQERLEKLESACSNTHQPQKGGDNSMNKFSELLAKYGKTLEDIKFEYKDLSDEELETKFAEEFGNYTEGTGENLSTDGKGEDHVVPEDNGGEPEQFEKMVRTYEISHEDTRYALYVLLEEYESVDNEWYFINSVYDTYFTYENWTGDKIYGQAYIKDGDNVAFSGERYNLHRELLTDSEYAELQSMRSNYSSIMSELNTYKENELVTKKEELFNSKDYDGIRETKEFVELKNKSKEYSIEELTDKLDKVISNSVKNGTFSFTEKELNKKKPVYVNFAQKLADEKPKKNSFLDGLLNC